MSYEEFPNEFDIIILGTGLTSTIAAAAFSRIGLKILHLDRNDYYGGTFGNFNLDGIDAWKRKQDELKATSGDGDTQSPECDKLPESLPEGVSCIKLPREKPHAFNLTSRYHVRERTAEEEAAAKASRSTLFPFSCKKIEQPTSPDTSESSKQGEEETASSDPSNRSQDSSDVSDKNEHEIPGIDSTASETEERIETEATDGSNNQKPVDAGCGKEETKTTQAAVELDSTTTCNVTGETKEECKDASALSHATDKVKEGDGSADAPSQGDNGMTPQSANGSEGGTLAEKEKKKKEWTVGDIKDGWRRYCFDISPKILHCCGDIVNLLVRSDVARYCEFRSVNRVLTLLKDKLEEVPCSRASLFSSKIVSLIEKRLMMKFLQFAADYENHPEEYEGDKGLSFTDFLKSKKLTPNLQHFVQHAIAMVPDTCSTQHGLARTKKFLKSLSLYGSDGAFLFPMYGTGELSQAFSRLSAVFGGTYCLTETATHVLSDAESKCCGVVISSGQKVDCKYLIAEASYLPTDYLQRLSSGKMSRAIYITDASIHSSSEDPLTLLNFICNDDSTRPVTVLELPSSACVCPKDLYVVYLTRASESDDPEEDLREVRERLFAPSESSPAPDESRPRILWSTLFTLHDWSRVVLTGEAPGHVLVASEGGDAGIDVDFCVEEAKQLFHTVCPDEEFLPTPPNPEDIIHGNDEEKAEGEKTATEDGSETTGDGGAEGEREGVKGTNKEDEGEEGTNEEAEKEGDGVIGTAAGGREGSGENVESFVTPMASGEKGDGDVVKGHLAAES